MVSPPAASVHAAKRLLGAYFLDYLLILAVGAGILISNSKMDTHNRLFRVDDPDIAYRFAEHETIPTSLLAVLSTVVTLLLILIHSTFIARSFHIGHHGVLALLLALGLTGLLTDIFKNWVGRLRPDFLDRCQPLVTSTTPVAFSVGVFKFYDGSVCTATVESRIRDGRLSWPSGHASYMFAGMTILVLFFYAELVIRPHMVQGKPRIRRRKSEPGVSSSLPSPNNNNRNDAEAQQQQQQSQQPGSNPSNTIAPSGWSRRITPLALSQLVIQNRSSPFILVIMLPFAAAILVATSRVRDNRHNPSDVISGAIIGIAVAYSCFVWYWFGRAVPKPYRWVERVGVEDVFGQLLERQHAFSRRVEEEMGMGQLRGTGPAGAGRAPSNISAGGPTLNMASDEHSGSSGGYSAQNGYNGHQGVAGDQRFLLESGVVGNGVRMGRK